jgi:hypothetical protein
MQLIKAMVVELGTRSQLGVISDHLGVNTRSIACLGGLRQKPINSQSCLVSVFL